MSTPEARAQVYLVNLRSRLEEKNNASAAATVSRALDYFEQRFWYELSSELLQLIRDPMVLEDAYELYADVIVAVRADISPIAYVMIVRSVCFAPHSTTQKALELVEGACASLIHSSSEQGHYAALCIRALLLLESTSPEESAALAAVPGSPPHTARKLLEQTEMYLHGLKMHEVEPVLVALYGMARGRDYEIRRQHTSYYKNAFDIIIFLEKADLPMRDEDVTALAYKTVVAGLLSDKIFNFGKLLNFDQFVSRLQRESCPQRWALEMMRLCNEGDVANFEAFFRQHQQQISQEPQLVSASATLHRKVRLMALLHLIFYTPLSERTFAFHAVAQRCGVPDSGAEPLLLEALAHGIIKGRMDGLKREVRITWVESRVLSLEEVKALAQHVSQWREQVVGLTNSVKEMTKKIPQ
ncbi:RPN9 / proteasome regulatory non-ATP-ase subunit 9 [Leishmania donovani]|uniref:Proteasome_regulatory_non-ATP-ase_subunit_9_-_putative n=3 Tax=Leishmania donovani species complex TaxID=38574 RepID=A0A6L0XKC8_LEIIN|nr:putative proteasome regulatory non-ATP-ase subunit [Leishmania infantum JPCM5]TPP41768.1 PCI domain family protein [Leishmania donovani]CAC9483240.1 proteasome_regulatory_non-ATP-ase_subunit_9_-_putative [Leishmania infantum]CAJ1988233.1 RPN9 / proteasome regulatory non-ATP-ase subunit 9 [Leishmania donovani]CAM67313.1 putative proteasome regulatory non-ATP-ase subunit [Leishmania infantum JPCM5]SUZ41214.1 proteasome_regulatory_non-ATP-ase_subunit_9_-_putative [Leishmania infantum]|eukprot:XP_001465070.1 putative proteasome regulatory non-ATP-ase subunit [Leishmania infantum JPCM5]